MKKIIMIYPKTELDKKGKSVGLPLSLMHAVSMIGGYKIVVIDQRVDDNWEYNLKKNLDDETLCVGISCMTGSQIKHGLDAAKIIRKDSKAKIIFGGVHPSLLPNQTLMDNNVDIIVIGEAEITFRELVEALDKNKDLSKIKGIGYKKDNKIIINKTRRFADINKLPFPDYNLVDYKKYFLNLYTIKNALSLVTGRGCPHRCGFCYNVAFNKRKWRELKAKEIVRRMKKLKKLGAESIDIIDDNFFVNLKRVKEFCKLVKKEKLNLKFIANIRIDYIARLDLEFLKLLKETGFSEFYVGIESGSEKTLKHMKKDITVEQIYEGNEKLKKVGISTVYSFMAGLPGESREDIKKTIDSMIRLSENNPYASLTSLKVFTPFPGTALFGEAVRLGMKVPNNFEEWSNFHFNSAKYSWKGREKDNFLEKLSYLTYFLDQKTMIKHMGSGLLTKKLIKLYSKIVKLRCKYHFYSFTPEITLMKILRGFID